MRAAGGCAGWATTCLLALCACAASRSAPASAAAGDRSAAEESYRKGQGLFQQHTKEANEASIAWFEKAIEQDPSFAPAHAALALAYSDAMIYYGRPRTLADAVVEHARRSVEIDPNYAFGYKALSDAYFAQGRMRKSLEAAEKAYQTDPAHKLAVEDIAFMHLDLGDLDQAVPWNRLALELDPKSAYAHRNQGRLHFMFAEDDEAERWLRKSMELDPNLASARILLVYLLQARGRTAEAQKAARAMLERAPTEPYTLNFAADAALMRADLDEARRLFEKAIAAGEDSRNFYRSRRAKTGLGYVLWKQGDQVAARRVFSERIAVRSKEYANDMNAWGPPMELATIYSVLGDKPESLRWVHRMVETGWREPRLARSDVLFENLRGDLEFEAVLTDVQRLNDELKRRAAQQQDVHLK